MWSLAEPDGPEGCGGISAKDIAHVSARRDECEKVSRRVATLKDVENELGRARMRHDAVGPRLFSHHHAASAL
jgi:hypothetical protein